MRKTRFDHSLIPSWKDNDTAFHTKMFTEDQQAEYFRARRKFSAFHSGHEGIAVIREEYLELETVVFKSHHEEEDIENMYLECIQIAAMAMAFAIELVGHE